MYSGYLPPDTDFRPIPQEEEPSAPQGPSGHGPPPGPGAAPRQKPPGSELLGDLTSGVSEFLSGIFKNFSLKNLDSGDILLLLIILFLFLEGDNLDLVIALGLMLLLGLGEDPQPSA